MLRNAALAMLLQAVAYAVFVWGAWRCGAGLWWAPPATALAIMVADWHRFTTVVLPQFFGGVGALIGWGRAEAPSADEE
jgi:hypothetical protein